ncbi:MAG TPA: hypothetical protein VFA12_14055 [Stellaceae bacterium]|nr:hypothetical protein [Stellaceae bacterium]
MKQAQLDELIGSGPLAELAQRLCALPEAKFLAVVGQLERHAHVPAIGLLMDACRPRLRQLRPPRVPSLKRLFCRPFEDLLVSRQPPEGLAKARILRDAVDPCWAAIKAAGQEQIAELEENLRGIAPGQAKLVFSLGERLWQTAGRLLSAARSGEAPDAAQQTMLMRDALLAAPAIERFKREVPTKPVPKLGKPEKTIILECIEQLATQRLPTNAFLLVLAARVKQPAELIEILAGTDVRVPEEVESCAVAQLVDRVNRLDETITETGPEGLAKEIEEVLQAMAETGNVLGKSVKNGLDENVVVMEQAARAALDEHVIEAAPAALEAAFEDAPGQDALLAAEAHARALYRSRHAAKKLGLGAKAEAAMAAARERFEARLAEELKAAAEAGNSEGNAAIFRAIRMIELVAGTEAARPHIRALMSGR